MDYQTVKKMLNPSVSHYYNKSELDIEKLKLYVSEIVEEISRAGVSDLPDGQFSLFQVLLGYIM